MMQDVRSQREKKGEGGPLGSTKLDGLYKYTEVILGYTGETI